MRSPHIFLVISKIMAEKHLIHNRWHNNPHLGVIHKYLLKTFFRPATALDTGAIAVNRTEKNPCPHGGDILMERYSNR